MSGVDTSSEKHKHKKKSRDKEKPRNKPKSKELPAPAQVSAHGRNEGIDPNWAYAPPAGMSVLDTTHMDEAFDWDDIKNDENKELWVFRVPIGFKLTQLQGLELQQPSDVPGVKLTTLAHKRAQYDVWAVDPSSPMENVENDDAVRPPHGQELTTISCLLPRKKKAGRLYISPKPISQHVIITHAPAAPQIDTESAPSPSLRYRVPKHLLKHRFLPYGAASSDNKVERASHARDGPAEIGMNEETVNVAQVSPTLVERTPTKKPLSSPQTLTSKSKKRKPTTVEDETPKRSKKLRF